MSHDGDRRVGGKTSKREMSSSSFLYSYLQKLVKVTSTSASLSYVDDSGDVIAIENDEGHQLYFDTQKLIAWQWIRRVGAYSMQDARLGTVGETVD